MKISLFNWLRLGKEDEVVEGFPNIKVNNLLEYLRRDKYITARDLVNDFFMDPDKAEELLIYLYKKGIIKKYKPEKPKPLSKEEQLLAEQERKEDEIRLLKIKKLLAALKRPNVTPCPKCKNSDYVVQVKFGMVATKKDAESQQWYEVGLLPGGYHSRGCVVGPSGKWICEKCSTEFYENGEEVEFTLYEINQDNILSI